MESRDRRSLRNYGVPTKVIEQKVEKRRAMFWFNFGFSGVQRGIRGMIRIGEISLFDGAINTVRMALELRSFFAGF